MKEGNKPTYVFRLQLFVVSSHNQFFEFFQMDVEKFDVLQSQLLADDFQVSHGIDVALDMRNVVVLEGSWKRKQTMQLQRDYSRGTSLYNIRSRNCSFLEMISKEGFL